MNGTWLRRVFGQPIALHRLAGPIFLLTCLALAGNSPAMSTSTLPATNSVCPPSIGFGETIQCSIDSAAETDLYTFAADAGDRVLVRMSKSSGTLWPGIMVYRDGPKLCTASDPTLAEITSCILPVGGVYTILAHDGFNTTLTGSYSLYLQRLNNPANALPIKRGQVLAGSIASPLHIDTYTFIANAGDNVSIRMKRVSGTLRPGLRVYAPGGIKLCEASDPTTAKITSCGLTSSGAHTILAYDAFDGNLTGSYHLYLECCNVYLPLILRAR